MITHDTETAASGSDPTAEQPNWRDANAQLKGEHLAAQQDLSDAEARGDRDAAAAARAQLDRIGQRFYETNKGLAVSAARKFAANGKNVDDYLAAAACGLWEAFTRWDPQQGTTFGTFSRQFINGRIHRTVRQVEFAHLSQNEFNLRKQVRTAQAALAAKLGRNASLEEIATATGLPVEKVSRTLANGNASLEAPVGDSDATAMDLLVAKAQDSPISLDGLEDVMDELSNLELWIITARSDLLGGDPQDIKDIANTLGVGREIIRRVATRGALTLAAAQYAKLNGRIPTDEQLAEFTGKELEHVSKYRKPGMRDMRERYDRILSAIARAGTRAGTQNAHERLDRFGQELLDLTEELARELSGKHEAEPGIPIGVDEAYWAIFQAFLTWDEAAHGPFTAWARACAKDRYGKPLAKANPDTEPVDKDTTWTWIRRRALQHTSRTQVTA